MFCLPIDSIVVYVYLSMVCPRGTMDERSKLSQPPSLRHLTAKDYGKLKDTQRKVAS